MSKGIIVVDVPENCGYCDFNALCGDGKHRCGVGSIEDIIDGYEDSIPYWCPIKPYDPEKIVEQLEAETKSVYNEIQGDYFNYVEIDKAIEIVKGGQNE